MSDPRIFPVTAELQIDGEWVDVSGRLRKAGGPVTIERGREDESATVRPTTTSLVLDNKDGALTPLNPMSPWYPTFGRSTPLQVSLAGGVPHVVLDGDPANHVSTPDHGSLDITGDLWLAAEVALDDWHDFDLAVHQTLIGKWEQASNQRSYMLRIFGGFVGMLWSPDGTNVLTRSRLVVSATADGRMAVAAHLDVDNGASGHTVTIYVAPRLEGPWTQMGDPIVTAGTTSIFSSSAPLRIGPTDTSTVPDRLPFAGRGYRFEVRSVDMAGTIAANPDFTVQDPGDTSFVDTAAVPKTWTLQGAAAIADKQVRVRGDINEVALRWPQPRQRGSGLPDVANVAVTAAGFLRRMQQGAKPLQSTLRRLVASPSMANNVVAYWPLEDGRDATSGTSPIPGVAPMGVGGGLRFGADTSLAASAPLPSVPSGSPFGYSGVVPPATGTQWRVDMFVYIETPIASPASTAISVITTTGAPVVRWAFSINDTVVNLTGRDADLSLIVNATFPSDDRFFGTWALWSLNLEQDGGNVDWTLNLVPIPLGAAFGTSGTTSGTVGRVARVQALSASAPPDGISFGHFIVSTGLDLGWLAGGDTAWVGETAAHRFYRLCREERIPMAVIGDPTVTQSFRGDPERSELMGPQRIASLPDLLQECADADVGLMFERRNAPGLAFRSRQSLHNQGPAVVLDMSQRGLAEPFEPVLDDQRLMNDVTASRPDGSSARVTTDPPPVPGDLYDTDASVNVQSDGQLPDQAGWRLHLATWPSLRYRGLASSMRAAGPAVTRGWGEADLGDKITADNLMRQHDPTADVLLNGYTEELDPWTWWAQINGSPAGPWEVGVRDDDMRGKRDTAGSELASGIDGDDTSLSVATTLGPLWTDDNAEDGFDVFVGGERMTVTDISGTSSPQTFTVARSVNGVVKSHAAGAAVRLWRPTVRAL